MRTLMYAVGTTIGRSKWRKMCVTFRPKTSSDQEYLRIVYGNGCSSTVSNHHSIDHCLMTDLSLFFYIGRLLAKISKYINTSSNWLFPFWYYSTRINACSW